MRNFYFNMSGFNRESLRDCAYKISQANKSYSFFKDEYISLPRSSDGGFLVPPCADDKKDTNPFKERLARFKELLLGSKEAIRVPSGSDMVSYFLSEYRNSITRDLEYNLIVPADEYPKIKTR